MTLSDVPIGKLTLRTSTSNSFLFVWTSNSANPRGSTPLSTAPDRIAKISFSLSSGVMVGDAEGDPVGEPVGVGVGVVAAPNMPATKTVLPLRTSTVEPLFTVGTVPFSDSS